MLIMKFTRELQHFCNLRKNFTIITKAKKEKVYYFFSKLKIDSTSLNSLGPAF